MFPGFIRTITKRISLLLIAYGLCRLFFLYWNPELFAGVPTGQIALAFVHGLRFDLAIILLLNAILIPLWLLPSRLAVRKTVRWTELGLFTMINLVAISANVIDAEYVKFIGKRNSFDLLFLRDDIERQLPTLLAAYWYMTIAVAALIALIAWVAPRFKLDPRESVKTVGFWGWRFAFIVVAALGIRGGVQVKPLHPMHAYFSTRHELGLLALNTPFNIARTKPRGAIRTERYFETDKEAIDRLQGITQLSRPPLGVAKDWNVVILILESFSMEYVGVANGGKGYTPFIDELAKKPNAFFFPLNFANARRSIEGLPAVLCALPAMMAEPVITSDFSSNRFDCLPKVLGKLGYSTYFLHGAHNGSMHFDTFSRIAGFENFVGLSEYPKSSPADLDPYWGVLDEPMLQYGVKVIDEAKKPVLLTLFSLSSHSPYFIPPQHVGKFPKGTLEIHETIGYTDYSLRQFFKAAESKDWYSNTIFVITADHTQKTDQPRYSDLIGPWRVPLLFYVPGLKPGFEAPNLDRITQHVDVVPSLLDLLGMDKEDRILVGQSVFEPKGTGQAFNHTHYSYWYLTKDRMVELALDGKLRTSVHKDTFGMKKIPNEDTQGDAALMDLKATIHYLNEGLRGNSLHTWRQSQ